MSIEVDSMAYQFQPSMSGHGVTYDAAATAAFSLDREREVYYRDKDKNVSSHNKKSLQTWFYNPIHDLESLFWLFVYFVHYRDIELVRVNPWHPRDPAPLDVVTPVTSEASNEINRYHLKLPPNLQEPEDERAERIKAQYGFAKGLFVERGRRLATLNITRCW